MSRKVRVRVNEQQAEVIDRIVARGNHGDSRGAAIRSGFLEFWRGRGHPLAPAKGKAASQTED